MIATGALAFANARVRALKSRLLGREIVVRASRSATARQDLSALASGAFRELVDWYHIVLTSYPGGQALILALLRRHEIENVKLAWRAIVGRHPYSRWAGLWIPLDRLATVRIDDCRDCHSLDALVEALRTTPYAEIGDAMRRAHAHDLPAAEMGFDRWTSRAIVREADALPLRDVTARDLALAVVRERDVNIIRRARRSELEVDVLAGTLGYLHRELSPAELIALSLWSAADGPLSTALPRRWQREGGNRVADWDAWLLLRRRGRRATCRRAFLDQPFCLSPAIALLLLKEEEVRGLAALAESADVSEPGSALELALSASALGA